MKADLREQAAKLLAGIVTKCWACGTQCETDDTGCLVCGETNWRVFTGDVADLERLLRAIVNEPAKEF